jgi:hypothetical protein
MQLCMNLTFILRWDNLKIYAAKMLTTNETMSNKTRKWILDLNKTKLNCGSVPFSRMHLS